MTIERKKFFLIRAV